MPQDTARERWIRNRVTLPTAKNSAEIARDIPADIRARSFFSARVCEAHIADRFRKIEDDYLLGRIGRDEARNLMMEYAIRNGADDGTNSLRNLASTARVNLIIDQNAKMARAVGDYERMYSPTNMEAFPYVIYHASVGSKNPRSEHQKYDGMIFEKNDPWLRSHWPPWEFGCNCRLENCSAKKAGKYEKMIQKPSPPDVAGKVYSKSGFKFDPAEAFESADMSLIQDTNERYKVYRQLNAFTQEYDHDYTLKTSLIVPAPTCERPENLGEINQTLAEIKDTVDNRETGKPIEWPKTECSLGKITKDRLDSLGITEDFEVFLVSPGTAKRGMLHWKDHHLKDWKLPDAIRKIIDYLAKTIWNPQAEMKVTIGKNKQISVTSPDEKIVANLYKRGEKWEYDLMDAWDISGTKNPKVK